MIHSLEETIAAVCSPPGGAARGIVRLSGPGVIDCLKRVFRSEPDQRAHGATRSLPEAGPLGPAAQLPLPRRATVVDGSIQLDGHGRRLPCELYLWPAGKSYTGQMTAEIHTLGSPPLLEALLQRLFQAGARLAEPGEFTLRAFLCNRIDLTQAEAVLGVIDAATPRQFQVALNQLAGGLARPLRRLRDCLLDLLADLEAGLDFADEDLELLGPGQIQRQLAEAAETVAALRDQMARRGVASPTSRVAIIGWPNTGKSSLFNALLGRAGAIVSDQAGTTRDYLTAELDLDGVRVVLVDTAGVEPASRLDPVTGAAQAAGAEQAATAQLRLLCIDSTRPLNGWERAELRLRQADRLIVLTKCDLPPGTDFQGPAVATSSLTGHGLQSLWGRIREAAVLASGPQADVVAATARRCTHSLRLAAACLDRAAALAREGGADELVASEIRVALDELGQVVGAVYTEDLLDRVFSRFCIGK